MQSQDPALWVYPETRSYHQSVCTAPCKCPWSVSCNRPRRCESLHTRPLPTFFEIDSPWCRLHRLGPISFRGTVASRSSRWERGLALCWSDPLGPGGPMAAPQVLAQPLSQSFCVHNASGERHYKVQHFKGFTKMAKRCDLSCSFVTSTIMTRDFDVSLATISFLLWAVVIMDSLGKKNRVTVWILNGENSGKEVSDLTSQNSELILSLFQNCDF